MCVRKCATIKAGRNRIRLVVDTKQTILFSYALFQWTLAVKEEKKHFLNENH